MHSIYVFFGSAELFLFVISLVIFIVAVIDNWEIGVLIPFALFIYGTFTLIGIFLLTSFVYENILPHVHFT